MPVIYFKILQQFKMHKMNQNILCYLESLFLGIFPKEIIDKNGSKMYKDHYAKQQ